jgi:hypothetical protein
MSCITDLSLAHDVELAQREWTGSSNHKSKQESWNSYQQVLEANERIASTAASLHKLVRGAKRSNATALT